MAVIQSRQKLSLFEQLGHFLYHRCSFLTSPDSKSRIWSAGYYYRHDFYYFPVHTQVMNLYGRPYRPFSLPFMLMCTYLLWCRETVSLPRITWADLSWVAFNLLCSATSLRAALLRLLMLTPHLSSLLEGFFIVPLHTLQKPRETTKV